jgi:hypothetical protein
VEIQVLACVRNTHVEIQVLVCVRNTHVAVSNPLMGFKPSPYMLCFVI